MELRKLQAADHATAHQLLQQLSLPFTDLDQEQLLLFSLHQEDEIQGIGGLEVYEKYALIRSVAIFPSHQQRGHGSTLVDLLEEKARNLGIEQLYLLTTTAESFFHKKGYQTLHRANAPEVLQQTTEFSALCPDTAVCMKKTLIIS